MKPRIIKKQPSASELDDFMYCANMQSDINDLLYCASAYDDKPHHLFSCIMRLADVYIEEKDVRERIKKLMDYAYNNKGAVKEISK